MNSSPFENIYRLRKVAEIDAKSCFICYKPSVFVLVTSNQKDFFYVCKLHLKTDKAFSEPIYESDERLSLIKELKKKEDTEKIIVFLINEKSSSWNKIMGWTDGSKKQISEDKNGNSKESEAMDRASGVGPGNSAENRKPLRNMSLSELQTQLKDVKADQIDLKAKIKHIEDETKIFKLNKDIFNIRLSNFGKKIYNQKRMQQIQLGSIFPTVPKNEV